VNRKRLLLPMLAAALAGAAAVSTLAAASGSSGRSAAPLKTKAALSSKLRRAHLRADRRLVGRLRKTVSHWQAVMGLRRAVAVMPAQSPGAVQYWRRQARNVARLAANPPHKRGWLCIHRYEGHWTDGSDPYWGGLQMDRGFMQTYAPRVLRRRGWANRWTPLEQMWVAERAHRSGRGYWPWPNTARNCGLL
jgi:hypothetical protein